MADRTTGTVHLFRVRPNKTTRDFRFCYGSYGAVEESFSPIKIDGKGFGVTNRLIFEVVGCPATPQDDMVRLRELPKYTSGLTFFVMCELTGGVASSGGEQANNTLD